ncbi:MAG: hypothetical protein H7145_24265 [Akkermansiaceae bacterium]|nr:hypothetical protein [Armatimonadota bacterium]
MEAFLVLALIVLFVFVYPWLQDRREEQLAERIAAARGTDEAAALIDRTIATSRHEADYFRRLSDHRP